MLQFEQKNNQFQCKMRCHLAFWSKNNQLEYETPCHLATEVKIISFKLNTINY